MAPPVLKTLQQQEHRSELSAPTGSGLQQQQQVSCADGHFYGRLAEIRRCFHADGGRINVNQIWSILEGLDAHKSRPDWAPFAQYDTRLYKRNLVDHSPHYNVMLLSWAPGAKSCIHDHSGSHCFMKMLDGELIEWRFAWPQHAPGCENQQQQHREMRPISSHRLALDKVLYINDKVGLHCVENASKTRTAASLHVYIPPFKVCQAFDQRTGSARNCKLSFDNVPSSETTTTTTGDEPVPGTQSNSAATGNEQPRDRWPSCRDTLGQAARQEEGRS